MIIHKLEVGFLEANCYILASEKTKEGVVIDPGGEAERILKVVKQDRLKIKYIINTHGHFDHIAANAKVAKDTKALICVHAGDAKALSEPGSSFSLLFGAPFSPVSPDVILTEGQVLKIGELNLKVLHTPGHTPGSISILAGQYLFTGDLLFSGSVGRTDFPGSSHQDLLKSLREKVMCLPEKTQIYPGHGPETTLAKEKESNPFLKELQEQK